MFRTLTPPISQGPLPLQQVPPSLPLVEVSGSTSVLQLLRLPVGWKNLAVKELAARDFGLLLLPAFLLAPCSGGACLSFIFYYLVILGVGWNGQMCLISKNLFFLCNCPFSEFPVLLTFSWLSLSAPGWTFLTWVVGSATSEGENGAVDTFCGAPCWGLLGHGLCIRLGVHEPPWRWGNARSPKCWHRQPRAPVTTLAFV